VEHRSRQLSQSRICFLLVATSLKFLAAHRLLFVATFRLFCGSGAVARDAETNNDPGEHSMFHLVFPPSLWFSQATRRGWQVYGWASDTDACKSLLIVVNDAWRRFAHFKLRAHVLQTCSKRLNLLLLPRDCRSLFLHFLMCFEEIRSAASHLSRGNARCSLCPPYRAPPNRGWLLPRPRLPNQTAESFVALSRSCNGR